jgi:RHS repeat-associated protein
MKINSLLCNSIICTIAICAIFNAQDSFAGIYVSHYEYTCVTGHTDTGGPSEAHTMCFYKPIFANSDSSLSSGTDNLEASVSGSDGVAAAAAQQIDPCSDPQASTTQPVLISSGTKLIPESDFSVGGTRPLGIGRTYVSTSNVSGAFGSKWSSTLDYGLRIAYDFEICEGKLSGAAICSGSGVPIEFGVRRPGGGYLSFTKDASNVWHLEPGFTMQQVNAQWVLTEADGSTEIYNAAGQPLTVRDARNIGWTFNYDTQRVLVSIAHTDGRSINVNWANGKVSSITAPGGGIYSYSYNANGYLSGVIFPSGLGSRTYHYEQAGQPSAVTGISVNGVRYKRYAYNTDGTVNNSGLEGGADKSSFVYTPTYTEVTNALGNKKRYNLTDVNGAKIISSVQGTASTACPSGMSNSTFDTNNNVIAESDERGNKSEFTYTPLHKKINQRITGVASNGDRSKQQITQLVWDATEQRVLGKKIFGATTNELINEMVYDYYPLNDTNNRSLLIKSVTEYDRTSTLTPNPSRQTNFDYTLHANKNVAQIRIDGPVNSNVDTTVSDYDTFGNMTKQTDAAGNFSTYANYTALGKPGRVTSENGVVTDYLYDAKGRVTKTTLYGTVGNIVVDYLYNALDDVTRVSDNAGNWLNYEYDATGRLLSISQQGDSVGPLVTDSTNKMEYSYNLYNQITANRTKAYTTKTKFVMVGGEPTEVPVTTIQESRTNFTDYDTAGFMSASRGNQGQNVRYFYDEAGRLASRTDSLNRVTSYGYDTHGRVVSSLAPDNGLTQLEYTALGQVSKVTDPRGKITQYTYNGFGELINQSSPDTGISTFEYDIAGRIFKKSTPDSRVSTYTYDALSRVVSITETWPRTVAAYQNLLPAVKTFSYDSCLNGKGRLCGFTDASGSTAYEYTPLGQYSKQTSIIAKDYSASNAYVLTWSYDNFARLNQFTYPNGNALRYSYDAKHRVSKVESRIGATGAWTIAASELVYQPFGPITSFKNANGLYRVKNYDSSGRVTSIDNGTGVQSLTYAYNANNLITGITNNTQTSLNQSYGYDTNSRVTTANGGGAGNQSFIYDLNGNRTSHTWSGGTDTYNNYQYGNQLIDISGARARAFRYDKVGNVIEDAQNGVATKFIYDASNRMFKMERASPVNVCRPTGQCFNLVAGTWAYIHNALGQRVSKNTFLNATPGVVTRRQYIYDPNGQMTAEANGDTGIIDSSYVWMGIEPLAVIKGTNYYSIHSDHLGRPEKVTNSAKVVVWKAENYAFDRNITLDNISGLNLGFPGQYYDQESETFYNYFRTYDGSLGRYQQSDPIGLAGGLNAYVYGLGNPTRHTDRFGLSTTVDTWCRQQPAGCAEALGGAQQGTSYAPAYLGTGWAATIWCWMADCIVQTAESKPNREQRPDNCPTGTKPIDKYPGLDRGDIHGIKDGINAGAKDWVGISPDGHVWINEDGEGSDQGPYEDYLP